MSLKTLKTQLRTTARDRVRWVNDLPIKGLREDFTRNLIRDVEALVQCERNLLDVLRAARQAILSHANEEHGHRVPCAQQPVFNLLSRLLEEEECDVHGRPMSEQEQW